MIHADGLIATIAIGLGVAFVGGFAATRLHLPAIVGYLLAGVVVGPFTPGFVANAEIAHELAEIGVILLMFGVGIHFSVRDLLSVKGVAVPGAIAQIVVATALGVGVSQMWGWPLGAGVVLGLAISVASTVVLLRALAQRDALDSTHGRVAVGWLIVEDLFTVLVLVLLPVLAPLVGGEDSAHAADANANANVPLVIALLLGKVAIFGAIMLVGGTRAMPWLLAQVSRTGSRELFTLSVLAIALGIALAAAVVFDVSLALGAFLAGVVISESDLSHQAAADALPLRDAFAVLFFVSVGMLFDPVFLLSAPLMVAAVLAVVVLGKGIAALAIVALLGYPLRTGLTVAAGLAQVGEFSFILADLGRSLGLLPGEGHSLILAAAIVSISLNPLVFAAVDPLENWLRQRPRLTALLERRRSWLSPPQTSDATDVPRGHTIVCGYGRVGRLVAHALERRGFTYHVIEQDRRLVEDLRCRGITALHGDAANRIFLEHASAGTARLLVVAFDDPSIARHVVAQARQLNPRLSIVARTHSETEWQYLRDHNVDRVVLGERELAAEMARFSLHRLGVGGTELQAIVQGLRVHGANA